ncbi:MAG TPA: methyl-accepting chemotaxis protein [Anaerolineaceae bacterium]|nr:methyl-accepting chemotaxis protein [Anaerolineaceae bacterium]
MDTGENQAVSMVGIVGGGKAGLQLFQLFSQSSRTRVLFVVDLNPEAPALQAARQAKVATYTDIREAIGKHPTDYVLEVTGSERVTSMLKEALANTTTQLITHDMASIILTVIDENRMKTKSSVLDDVVSIKGEINKSIASIEELVDNIDDIAVDMRYLALNARIEAARVGEAGRGFATVAEMMEKSASSVVDITREVEKVNTNIVAVSGKIEGAINRLN